MKAKFKAYCKERYLGALKGVLLLQKISADDYADSIKMLLRDFLMSNIDTVTDLVQRAFFFARLIEALKTMFPHFEETGEFTLPFEADQFGVAMGDLAFLGYFNKQSHRKGDAILRRVARLLAKYFRKLGWVVRYGGDEFAILFLRCLESEIARLLTKVQDDFGKRPMHYIDMGYATLVDVEDYFSRCGVPSERRIKRVAQVLVDVAMARAQIAKISTRILLFTKLYAQKPKQYQKYIGTARKGAGDITDHEIEAFATRFTGGEDLTQVALEYAFNVKWNAMRGDAHDACVFAVAKSFFV
jgi:diguanylate cyclase (GGDEF)-like protein